MKYAFSCIAAAALLTSALGQFTINTPTNVVVCQPVQFTWVGGTPPYFLSILPGSQPGATALESFDQLTTTNFRWVADIAAGTSIGLTIRDNTGQTAQSAPFNVLTGSDTSCVGKGQPSSSGGAATTGATTGAATSGGATTTAAGTPPAGTTTAAAPPPGTTGATSPAAGTTTRPATTAAGSNAGSSASGSARPSGAAQSAQVGAAGVIGAALLALLA